MAQLVYQITGDVTGLKNASEQASAILRGLKVDAGNLSFGGKGVSQKSGIELQADAATKALTALDAKLSVIRGNTELFGTSIKGQTSEIAAYQTTINKLLSTGYEPTNAKVIELKANIDNLTASIAAQGAATIKRPIISDSVAEVNAFAASSTTIGGNVEISGTDALIKQLNADFEAGTLSAAEYRASINQIGESQAYFAQQTAKATLPIEEEIGLLAGLNKELTLLRAQKPGMVDVSQLSRSNKLIQETEAEISRLNNIGKVGFDSTGVAIKGFGKTVEDSTEKSAKFGSGIRGVFGGLRQLAYILPGIGIAGLFNLGFEAIAKVAAEIDLFPKKINAVKEAQSQLNKAFESSDYKTAITSVSELTENIDLARKGFLNKTEVLNQYNKALGSSIGYAQDLDSAERNLVANGDAYIKITLLKAAAQLALKDAADQSLKAAQIAAKPVSDFGSIFDKIPVQNITPSDVKASQKNLTDAQKAAQKEQVANATKAADVQLGIFKDFQKKAAELAKANKIDFFDGTQDNKTDKNKNKENEFDSIVKSLSEIIQKDKDAFAESGLEDYALQIQKITDKYKDQDNAVQGLLNTANKLYNKGSITGSQLSKVKQFSQTGFDTNDEAKQKELADAAIKEAKRVSDEITRINNEFGVKSEQSRQKEILQVQSRYDAEVVKAKGNAAILSALDAGRLNALQAVNDKYAQIESDLWDKISLINEQAQSEIGDKTQVETGRIIKEWENRRAAANKYFDELQRIVASELGIADAITGVNISGAVAKAISGKQAESDKGITNAETDDINLAKNKDLLSGLQSATGGFISDFLSGLENANSEVGANFASVFAGIASSFQKTMENVAITGISHLLENQLEDGIKKGTIHLSAALQGAIAAAGIAGSVISGATPKTSVVGQGLGGALSGAASGALVGSVFGPAGTIAGGIIGGAVGLLGGIFGASKAQKELQAQQLAEQKQQTDLLKQSLAYTSQVIGRMTNQGVVTNVSVSAFGEIVTRINGKDLLLIIDRTKSGR